MLSDPQSRAWIPETEPCGDRWSPLSIWRFERRQPARRAALGVLAGAVILGVAAPFFYAELLIVAGALLGAAVALWHPGTAVDLRVPALDAPPPLPSSRTAVSRAVTPTIAPHPLAPRPARRTAARRTAARRTAAHRTAARRTAERRTAARRDAAESQQTEPRPVRPRVEPQRSSAVRRTGRGPKTVLVVDDHDSMLVLVNAFLTDAGYRVLEAEGGARALEVCRRHGDTIDLLLTDVRMPEMGGPELYRRVAERYPGIRVLFMSGFAREWAAEEGVPEGTAMIEKGFTPQQLQRRVKAVLNGG